MTLRRPDAHESHDYYKLYISQVAGDDFLNSLNAAMAGTISFLKSLEDEKWNYRYAEGKWSIKEVVLHMIDTERIFAYQVLRIARNDMTPIEGFEQDDYIPYLNADNRDTDSIIQEYSSVRLATLDLFRNFDDEMLNRIGTASGRPFSPRAIGFIIAGHEAHHLSVIRERYL